MEHNIEVSGEASISKINDYMFTHTELQLFPVSCIFGDLEKTIKYSMHLISKRLISLISTGVNRYSYASTIFDNPRLIFIDVVLTCAINDIHIKMICGYAKTTSTTFCY